MCPCNQTCVICISKIVYIMFDSVQSLHSENRSRDNTQLCLTSPDSLVLCHLIVYLNRSCLFPVHVLDDF